MQEVEIAPRDVYIYHIHVPKDKTISWWFSTKKKNISFGLYLRIPPAPSTTSTPVETFLPLASHKPPTLSDGKAGRASLHSLTSAVSRTSFDTINVEEAEDSLNEISVSNPAASLPD